MWDCCTCNTENGVSYLEVLMTVVFAFLHSILSCRNMLALEYALDNHGQAEIQPGIDSEIPKRRNSQTRKIKKFLHISEEKIIPSSSLSFLPLDFFRSI
jgi:hypothetical protein